MSFRDVQVKLDIITWQVNFSRDLLSVGHSLAVVKGHSVSQYNTWLLSQPWIFIVVYLGTSQSMPNPSCVFLGYKWRLAHQPPAVRCRCGPWLAHLTVHVISCCRCACTCSCVVGVRKLNVISSFVRSHEPNKISITNALTDRVTKSSSWKLEFRRWIRTWLRKTIIF